MSDSELLSILFKLALVLVLVGLNGFFVAAEFALVKIRDSQLQPLIDRGHRRARVAKVVLNNLDASLSACQLGITLASLALGWVGEPVFEALLKPLMVPLGIPGEYHHKIAFVVGIVVLTFFHVVVGEQAPKWLAIQRPLPTALWVVDPLQWFHMASRPFIWALNHASLWLLRPLGLHMAGDGHGGHSDAELRLLFSEAQKQRGGTALGRAIVMNALDLQHRVAREVMRPRSEIVVFSTEDSISQCIELAEKSRFSRFPLCEDGDLDRMLGVVHIKDLYAYRAAGSGSARDLKKVIRRLVYFPQMARLEKLLEHLLDRKLHMAIVVDEYGGTVGMVTLENILEELVGQIQDEFDLEKPMLIPLGNETWELQGLLPVHELAELTGERLEEEGVTTVSGWVTGRLEGFPRPGDVVKVGGYELRVEETSGHLVSRLTLKKKATPRVEKPPESAS